MTVGSQVKGCYASIKQIEATLQSLSNKAQDKEAQIKFNEAEQIMNEVKKEMEQQIIHLTREEPQYR